MTTIELMAYLGAFIGVLLNALIPYLLKLQALEKTGVTISFKPVYMATAILSFISTVFIVIMVFSMMSIPDTLTNIFAAFMFGLVFGRTTGKSINIVADYVDEDKPAPVTPSN